MRKSITSEEMIFLLICRQVWQSLGDMSQQHAMTEFVRNLIELCPQFTPYIKAHQAERDQLEKERLVQLFYLLHRVRVVLLE